MKSWKWILCVMFVVEASCQSPLPPSSPHPDKLGPQNVIKDKVTLSGFSSGGTMASMLQFAYSSLFCGIAVFSHTFYRCGPPTGLVDDYDRVCTTLFNLTDSEMYDPALVHKDIQEYLQLGFIEDPKNLKDKKLYVYSGLRNFLFTPRQSLNILQVYEPYIQNPAKIQTRVQDSVQLLPTINYGVPCNQSAEATEFLGSCGFSGVTEAINFLLSDEFNRTEAFQLFNATRGNLSTFDQTEFTKDLQTHNMDEVGYYYVPPQCQANNTTSGGMPCFLHFYFHGCLTGREFNGPRHIENSGLLELADRKNIVMIFPQAKSSLPENRIGCWDTFGLSGKYYATQQGPQVTAMKRMLDRVLQITPEPVPAASYRSYRARQIALINSTLTDNSTSTTATTSASTTPLSPAILPSSRISRNLLYLPPRPEVSSAAPQRRAGAYQYQYRPNIK